MNRAVKLATFFFLSLITLSTYVRAEEYTFSSLDDAKVSITFPNDWQVTVDRFQIRALPQDDSIYFGFLVIPKGTAENKVAELLSSSIDEMVTDFREVDAKAEHIEVNGMKFVVSDAVGKDKDTGDPLRVSLAYFTPDEKSGHLMAVVYFGTAAAEKLHHNQIQSVLKSIRNARQPLQTS